TLDKCYSRTPTHATPRGPPQKGEATIGINTNLRTGPGAPAAPCAPRTKPLDGTRPPNPRQCRLRKEALLFESTRQRSRVSGIRWSQYERPSFSSLQPDFIPSGHIHAGIQQHHGTRFPFRSRFGQTDLQRGKRQIVFGGKPGEWLSLAIGDRRPEVATHKPVPV